MTPTLTRGQRVAHSWTTVSEIGAGFLVAIGGFLLVPPSWDLAEDSVWPNAAHFIASAVVLLMIPPLYWYRTSRFQRRWWIAAVASLSIGIAAVFAYQGLRASWTVEYGGTRVVKGKTLLPHAVEFIKQHQTGPEKREFTTEDLVMAYAGHIEQVWEPHELHTRRLALAGIYSATVALLAVFLMAATHCVSSAALTRIGTHSDGEVPPAVDPAKSR